ncbi:MAG: YccF domain-containing protein [Actinobacteria bacterium]|nr:YccF domain-containing protein [Actinomycetota bacterium]
MLRLILNILWFVLAGVELALAYALAGLVSIVFIITIPLALPAFRLAWYSLWPFGRVVVEKPDAGAGSLLANIVWLVVVGWWLAVAHLAVALLLAITIIGIPFAVAVLKLAGLALAPYGKEVVTVEEAHHRDLTVVHRTERA